jgi:hypothetical protein
MVRLNDMKTIGQQFIAVQLWPIIRQTESFGRRCRKLRHDLPGR